MASNPRSREVVHIVDLLPGARESLPSVVYVLSVIGSFILGGVTVALIGLVDQELLQRDGFLIGGFLFGAGASLFGFFALIRMWVTRRS